MLILNIYPILQNIKKSAINNVLNINRTCPTRIATGTTSVSSVQSVTALWWKRPLPPRRMCCSALNATPTTIPPSAPHARKPSCQVCWDDDDDCDKSISPKIFITIHCHIYIKHNKCNEILKKNHKSIIAI